MEMNCKTLTLTREEYIRRTTENGKALVRRWGEIARAKSEFDKYGAEKGN